MEFQRSKQLSWVKFCLMTYQGCKNHLCFGGHAHVKKFFLLILGYNFKQFKSLLWFPPQLLKTSYILEIMIMYGMFVID